MYAKNIIYTFPKNLVWPDFVKLEYVCFLPWHQTVFYLNLKMLFEEQLRVSIHEYSFC